MISTVIGGTGFIGSHLVRHLKSLGRDVFVPKKGSEEVLSRPLGQVFYCAGLTADFRWRPFETIDAHVSYLARILSVGAFDSLLYLSSTRIYAGLRSASEDEEIRVRPNAPDDLYNISKVAGEALCLAQANPRVRIARLSNVVGLDLESSNFLMAVIREAVRGRIELQSSPESSKDYIAIEDVVSLLTLIADNGEHRVYNVASGKSIRHAEILERLQQLTGCDIVQAKSAPGMDFPDISVSRLKGEFPFEAQSILDYIPLIIDASRQAARE
ncbi:NAD-dependent epimerase/dehydratase family protein [Flaviflagellibacter deserti]|uniref:NAD-dependent epimerase/dehydratase family protein n=1 Tax=Flaviflagellibacter deserti TaxID=2267266 RepID=A0ABV9Z3E6_9HYPH